MFRNEGPAARPRVALRFETQSLRRRSALAARGWNATQLPPEADLVRSPGVVDSDAVVVGIGQGSAGDEAVAMAERYRVARGRGAIVMLAERVSEAQLKRAAELTPFVYPATVEADVLAMLLEGVKRTWVERSDSAAAHVRRVTIRHWESLEVDGARVPLGSAERNFLFQLASRRDARISKHESVDAGAGRLVESRECRRRLGKRLGEELASLLVPSERNEPYRLREPAEVAATCEALHALHVPTELRVIGRSSVRTLSWPDVDRMS
jgi:hypothetical protein